MAGTPTPPINDPSAPRYSTGNDAGLYNQYGIGRPTPGPGYQDIFQQNQNSYLGGFNPGDFLRAHGFSFNEGPSTGTTFNKGGQSYTNLGASHEGAGPGGESQFLGGLGYTPGSYAANLDPSKQYGGQIGMLDKAMASTAQGNLHDRVAQLTPADKQAMAASGKDIFGNSAFGVPGGDAVSSRATQTQNQVPPVTPGYRPNAPVAPNPNAGKDPYADPWYSHVPGGTQAEFGPGQDNSTGAWAARFPASNSGPPQPMRPPTPSGGSQSPPAYEAGRSSRTITR